MVLEFSSVYFVLWRRVRRARVTLAAMCSAALFASGCSNLGETHADGIVWQTDATTTRPTGHWQWLGVRDLLIQWVVVDDTAFVPVDTQGASGLPALQGVHMASQLPDWDRISREPWASNVILGLAGYSDEKRARDNIAKLADMSASVAHLATPLHVKGYYFPVEIDPSWTDASKLAAVLNKLPRPLWVTVYDRKNIGGGTLADWLATWLPADVGVFFQDGCGVYARVPSVARVYLDALSSRLGRRRVRVIAEAFRPSEHGGFRAATAEELKEQLATYNGYSVYLFDGPHYVSDPLVRALAPQAAERQGASR
ncbi:hypothetical protein D7S89_24435 [Trinickia fusca]|uniref:Uncharacterized protein n=1 Tax=Trinickia fusca TaxID=2419777 RepID=A0A494X6L0_9BURK|nr:hypothetical protein D7S89_24435 [Trinickia fusca]